MRPREEKGRKEEDLRGEGGREGGRNGGRASKLEMGSKIEPKCRCRELAIARKTDDGWPTFAILLLHRTAPHPILGSLYFFYPEQSRAEQSRDE